MIPDTVYLALLTKPAERDQSGLAISEPTSGKYRRHPIAMGDPKPVKWTNKGLTPWPVAGFALLTAPAGGTVIDAYSLDVAIVARVNDTVDVGDFDVAYELDLSVKRAK